MGKPRLIILVRHAQSEGNKNREIHQLVPDHRVKLTDEGWKQAEDAGHRLRNLLRPDDTLQVFTSPYRRTRETTEGILRTLTSPSPDDGSPSPFTREKIVVYEEPRLREQDFGNFQPCTAEMERMWQERADYGHFFYRIPNGESAADAYDRVSGFNESLWRQFGDQDFPSVLVLVTHGLMSRVFLMKWYHWSVEYFEDLRNVNHCEFVLMRQNTESGKFVLESELRTWSELKRQKAEEKEKQRVVDPIRRNTLSAFLKHPPPANAEKSPARQSERIWGGCPEGCDHDHEHKPRKEDRTEAQDLKLPAAADAKNGLQKNEADDHPLASREPLPGADGAADTNGTSPHPKALPAYLSSAKSTSSITRRSPSGAATPHERPSDSEDDVDDSYFSAPQEQKETAPDNTRGRDILATAMRRKPERKPTPDDIERWVGESGMGRGRQADALGDEPTGHDGDASDEEAEDAKKYKDEDDKGSYHGDGGSISHAISAPYVHPDEEEEAWHEERGWEYEEPSGPEMGRNAVERLVEMHMSDEEKGGDREDRSVMGSVF